MAEQGELDVNSFFNVSVKGISSENLKSGQRISNFLEKFYIGFCYFFLI